MNNFIDRDVELKHLYNIYKKGDKGSLVILYGRRRLGKTTLLKEFSHCYEIPYCYFMADRAGEESLKRSTAIAMAAALGEPLLNTVSYPSWYDLFAAFDKFSNDCAATLSRTTPISSNARELEDNGGKIMKLMSPEST
jgi:AAA+ ATPase superfamily predicted ATPase